MNKPLQRFLTYKNLGQIFFDQDLKILEVNQTALQILSWESNYPANQYLTDLFPELHGNEETIRQVVDKKATDFQLEFINRRDKENNINYIDLFITYDGEKAPGLLILEDSTEKAKLKQEWIQQKNELLLYQNVLAFRKNFLSESILGDSTDIREVRKLIQEISKVPKTTVLLLGESGTGKNLVARIIHYSSLQPDAPLVEINCAAIPENLIESELFGYEKGAFTHATATKMGLFEEAEGGTIFLDEIGELPPNLQAKLLNVLETKKFRRLGSNKPIEINPRVIAATNRDIQLEVLEGRFRSDLFYRLNVVSITLPSLRKMGKDILLIANHFLKIFNIEFKKNVTGFTKEAEDLLLNYPWPGNVRELSNCLERAMIFADKDFLDQEDLIIQNFPTSTTEEYWRVPPEGISLEAVEKKLLLSALQRSSGNKSKAARLLGLSRDTFRYRLEKHDLL